MTTYKCGHNCEIIFMNNDIIGLATYLTWKDETGFNGDKTKCFECYCKDLKMNEVIRKL